jgi:hypothetical protein
MGVAVLQGAHKRIDPICGRRRGWGFLFAVEYREVALTLKRRTTPAETWPCDRHHNVT